MSLEQALAEHSKVMTANTATLERVAANQEKLIAGQQAAIEKIDAKAGGAKAVEKPAKETAKPAAKETAKPAAKTVSDDDVKAAAVAWMGAATKGKSEDDTKKIKTDCAAFLGSILAHFGVGGKLTGPESKLDEDQRKQAKFYIQRKSAGLPVDFNAEYDFDGDVKQGAAAPAAEEEDPLG